MKLVMLMKMCINETHGTVWVDKNLCDMLPIVTVWKQGDALLSLFFNCALEYDIRRVQIIQDGL
jgi:hypothetical protein